MKDRMSAAEYREQIANPKPTKMHSKKVEVDGMLFPSLRQADHYCELKLRKRSGEIVNFILEHNFPITDGYFLNGKWKRPEVYRADSIVIKVESGNVKMYIEEPKGHRTQMYLNKKKLFQNKYPEYEFIEI